MAMSAMSAPEDLLAIIISCWCFPTSKFCATPSNATVSRKPLVPEAVKSKIAAGFAGLNASGCEHEGFELVEIQREHIPGVVDSHPVLRRTNVLERVPEDLGRKPWVRG